MKYGLNDIDEPVAEVINGRRVKCIFYRKWQNMLERCYSKRYSEKNPTYLGCSVCEDWLKLSKFKSWFDQQPKERHSWHLDKDILFFGNKVYSPETCLLIPDWLNSFIAHPVKKNGLPLGVSYYCNKATRPYLATGYHKRVLVLGIMIHQKRHMLHGCLSNSA